MLLESPSNPNVKQEVEQTFSASRMTLRPHDFKGPDGAHQGGHFRRVFTTGATTGIAAGGALLSFRWTNVDRAFLLNRIRAWATIGTAFTTAQEISCDLVRVTNFGSNDGAGTNIDLGESGRKIRALMAPAQVAQVRVADAAAVTPGANTVEEAAFAGDCFAGLLNVVGSMARATIYDVNAGLESPFAIRAQEGFRVRNKVLEGAVGVVVFTFEVDWIEMPTMLIGA